MKICLKKVVMTFFVTATLYQYSYAQFTFSGEVRPRSEYRHGFKALAGQNQEAAFFTDQRTRLNFDYVHEDYTFKIVLQDIRTWGNTAQLVDNDGAYTALHEGWAQLKIAGPLSLKIGRQEIIYDDHRIFGSVAWAQQARSHDAAVFRVKKDALTLDLGLAYNQDQPQMTTNFYTNQRNYKAMQYLWFHYDVIESFKASILFLNNGLQGPVSGNPPVHKINYSQTIGGRLSYAANGLAVNAAVYQQMGMEKSGQEKISAGLYSLDAGYAPSKSMKVTAGYEYQSGNSQVNPDTKNRAFNPFYGTNHKFNGLMDYFYVGNHAHSVGLQDIYLALDGSAGKFKASLSPHVFMSANEVADPINGTAIDSYLGTEIDLELSYTVSPQIGINGGYSQMIGSSTMEVLRGGDRNETSNWAWLMITVKPTFFTTKKEEAPAPAGN